MNILFYMDVHVPRAVSTALRLRGIDVLTAQQDDSHTLPDDLLLLRATSLGRVLVSQDDDLLREAARFQNQGVDFAGLIYAHQQAVSIGAFVEDLTIIAAATHRSDWASQVAFLPL